jgi:hypothetical protein
MREARNTAAVAEVNNIVIRWMSLSFRESEYEFLEW